MNQARPCTTGNTQGLLTIPKQLSDVNKKVAQDILTSREVFMNVTNIPLFKIKID